MRLERVAVEQQSLTENCLNAVIMKRLKVHIIGFSMGIPILEVYNGARARLQVEVDYLRLRARSHVERTISMESATKFRSKIFFAPKSQSCSVLSIHWGY